MNKERGCGAKGRLIIIEGIDGTGKTTLAKALCDKLVEDGHDAIFTFEPTNGAWGKRLREGFLSRHRLSAQEELELFIKDREEHVRELLLPSLRAGRIVICDRYYFSTMAYQGARGVSPVEVRRRNEAFAPRPDLMFIIELDPALALKRIREKRKEAPNNFENQGYLERVAAIFTGLSDPFIIRLDGSRSQDEVFNNAWIALSPFLHPKAPPSTT
ncbi:MAG: dTMP kinase [Desulfobacteraceae bacterium]|nr:dTMP kinase [Desulfobacteraceae bacterium]